MGVVCSPTEPYVALLWKSVLDTKTWCDFAAQQTSSESVSSEGGSRFESDWASADAGAEEGDADPGFADAPARPATRGADDGRRRLRSHRGCARLCGAAGLCEGLWVIIASFFKTS